MENNSITSEVINKFLEGSSPMMRITNIECGYNDEKAKIIYNNAEGKKLSTYESFYPFIWAKRSACTKLCNGNRDEVKRLMNQYQIGIKVLKNKISEEDACERMQNGYIFMFYAFRPMTYNKFIRFFKDAQNPIFSDSSDDEEKSKKNDGFLSVTPVEQFMISTGKRLFKGYDDYDNLTRLQFDIETEGLDPHRHRINQIGIRTNKGYERIISIIGETKEEIDKNELKAIKTTFQIIKEINPDVVAGYNSENFDFNFFFVRSEILGEPIEKWSTEIFNGKKVYKKKNKTVLKLGGETEYFNQTVIPEINVIDGLHAVRRAQAIDSNMQKADLKYITKYVKENKANRIYVPGDKIKITWLDEEENYALNDENGKWHKIEDKSLLENNERLVTGRYIVERYLLDDIYETDRVELRFNECNFLLCKFLPTTFQRACTMGTAGTWKMIMLAWSYENNLAIPSLDKKKKFTGGLSRLLKVGYVDRIVKLDFNSLYPSIILTWKIASELDITGVMLHLLEFLLGQRELFKKLKGDAKKQGNMIREKYQDANGIISDKEALSLIQKYGREELANDKKQLPDKTLCNAYFGGFGAPQLFNWGDLICAEKTTCIGRQSLRLMISWFSNLGYTPIVGDTDGFNFQMPTEDKFRYTKESPYIGKGLNRETKEGKEYIQSEGDVAEFNDLFMRGKMGLGIDEYALATINFTRKNYADMFPETDNNGEYKIKLVGNTVKSKKMPGYIEKFLNKGIRLLLNGKGQEFLEEYYKYIEQIYNYRIPLKDIASRGKIKQDISSYKQSCKETTKSGNAKSRQAWYELAIKDNVKVDVGDTIYYINIGKSKSHSDIKRITHNFIMENGEEKEITPSIKKKYENKWKEENVSKSFFKEKWKKIITRSNDELIFNSVRLDNALIEKEVDVFCDDKTEYNVSKYIDMFNKRITPLLVCFDKKIRDKILICNPSDRQYFTLNETVLSSGEPNRVGDQDTYEELMSMEDKEIRYWKSVNEEPPFIKECQMNWKEIIEDYDIRKKREDEIGITQERESVEEIISALTEEEIDDFIENGNWPKKILEYGELDPQSGFIISKKYNIKLAKESDIIENYEDINVNE